MCGFCDLDSAPDVRVRGLCPLSQFDAKYSWTRDYADGLYAFRGFQKTQLHLDSSAGQWRLTLDGVGENGTFASVNTTEYPFGTWDWDVRGDLVILFKKELKEYGKHKLHCFFNQDCLGSHRKTSAAGGDAFDSLRTIALNINSCTDTEFNCGDGYCVDISLRCDGDIDCPDKTGRKIERNYKGFLPRFPFNLDEVDCNIYEIDDSYIRESPPKGAEGEGSLAKVEIGVDVLSILEISEVDGYIALQLNLKITWYNGAQ